MAGLVISLWSLFVLGKNLSIIPQARKLVDTGPYRYVRRTTSSAVPNPGREVSVNPPSMLSVRARMFFRPCPAAVD